MSELSAAEAVERARSRLGLDARTPARAERVRRLDRPGESYYFVLFGADDATSAVAAVEAAGGDVASSARLASLAPHMGVGRERALELAGLGGGARAELVWLPCRATRSQLYPLWEVSAGGARVFVDQQGNVLRRLDAGGPGG